MLGYTKLATTQIYTRIVDQTVSNEIDKLSAKLSGTSFSTQRVILSLAEGAQHRNLAKALLDGVCNTLPKVVCILVRSYDEPICELDSRAVGE